MSIKESPNTGNAVALLDEKSNIELLNNLDMRIIEQIEAVVNQNEYNSIVTEANFSDMKKSATKLNAFANDINKFKIAKVKAETEDIEIFKGHCKKYIGMYTTKKDEIKKGMEIFEEKTKKQVLNVCIPFLTKYYEDLNIREEFKTVSVLDMTATKFMTATGNISKPGKDEVIARVNIVNSLQVKVDMRIMQLENECYKAGLKAPLTKEHIQGFIQAKDEVYATQLNNLIQSEVRRQKQIEEQIQKELEDKQKVENAKAQEVKEEIEKFNAEIKTVEKVEVPTLFETVQVVEEVKQVVEEVQEVKQVQEKTKVDVNGKVIKTVSFKISIPCTASDEAILRSIIKMLDPLGITADNIEVN